MIHVLIIDDQPLFRTGIHSVLEDTGNYTIIEGIPDNLSLKHLSATQWLNITIIGDLITHNPLDIAQQVRQHAPACALIFLTENTDEEYFFQALKVGAAAYLFRTIPGKELIETVSRVTNGEYLINDQILAQAQGMSRLLPSDHEQSKEEDEKEEHISPLTNREVEILQVIAQGKSNKEVARLLHISAQTVKNHLTSILKKLPVKDRTTAVVHAFQHGWIEFADEQRATS
jgi:DNA-binding NarL/FixJ family response regulator